MRTSPQFTSRRTVNSTATSPTSTINDEPSLYKRRTPSSRVVINSTMSSSSSMLTKRRKNKRCNDSARNSFIKSIVYNQSLEDLSIDPFDREFYDKDSSNAFYICPQAPVHSNEYLMNINAHKYHFQTDADMYSQLHHSGSMTSKSCGNSCDHTSCPYVTIASLEQENLALRVRIEELEQRVIQLETAT